MTIRDAIDQRIDKVRLPEWGGLDVLHLPLLPGGDLGPWAYLVMWPAVAPAKMADVLRDSCDRYEAVTGHSTS